MRVTRRVIGLLLPVVAGVGCSAPAPSDPDQPAPAAKLVLTSQPPATSIYGNLVSPAPRVALADARGTLVAQAGVSITTSIDSGGGDFTGTLTETTQADGHATFSNLVITGLVGKRLLRFTAQLTGGPASVVSLPVELLPGPPEKLVVVVQPSPSASSGVTLARQPSVQVQDVGGNPIRHNGVIVSAAGFEGCLLSSPVVFTDGNGVAMFSDLAVASGSSPFVRLVFSSPKPGSNPPEMTVISDTIAVAVRGRLAILHQPSPAVQPGVPFPTAPLVKLSNEAGDPVFSSWPITAAVVSGPGPHGFGPGSQETVVANGGLAIFSALNLTSLGSYTIQFSSECFQPVTSATVTVQP